MKRWLVFGLYLAMWMFGELGTIYGGIGSVPWFLCVAIWGGAIILLVEDVGGIISDWR